MQIADELTFKNTSHGSGANGMYVYDYEDTSNAGVHLEARRESRRHAEVRKWRHVALPDQDFPTFEELVAALEPVTLEQAEAERAKWPVVEVKPEGASLNNRCRLCPREPHTRATHRATVRENWVPGVFRHYAGLCKAHLLLADDPPALIAALDAELAARKSLRADLAGITKENP